MFPNILSSFPFEVTGYMLSERIWCTLLSFWRYKLKIITLVFSYLVHCEFLNFWESTLLHVVPRTIVAHCSWYNIWHFFHSYYCYIALVHLGVVVEVIYFLASERGTLWEYQGGLINMSGEWRQTPTDLVHLQKNVCCRFTKILFKTAVKGYYKSHAFTTFSKLCIIYYERT